MKMDRNINDDGLGKYAVINLRKLRVCESGETFGSWSPAVEQALKTLEEVGALEWGRVGDPDEFFLVKLKDRNARGALRGYAAEALNTDGEFAMEVLAMADRAGPLHPLCKHPD